MKYKYLILVSVITIIIVGILFYLYNIKSINNFARKNNFKINLTDNFEIKKYTENSLETRAQNGDILKITITDIVQRDKTDEIINTQKRQFLSSYESQLPPYPEFLNVKNSCGEKFLPVEKKSKYGLYFTTFAGRGLNYGICVDDMITHKAGLGFFVCGEDKKFIKVEYLIEKDDESIRIYGVMDSFECL